MRALCFQLWNDESGFVLSAELVLIGTIAILSLVVGLAAVASAVNSELRDCAGAFCSVQSGDRYGGGDVPRGGRGNSGSGSTSNWNGGDQDLVGWTPSRY